MRLPLLPPNAGMNAFTECEQCQQSASVRGDFLLTNGGLETPVWRLQLGSSKPSKFEVRISESYELKFGISELAGFFAS